MNSKTLSIIFRRDAPVTPDATEVSYPPNLLDDLRYNGQSLPRPPSDWVGRLKKDLRQAIDSQAAHPALHKLLRAWSNALMIFTYWPLFRNLEAIKKLIVESGFNDVEMDGADVRNYSAFTNRGDEGRTILYYPELLLPRYLSQALRDHAGVPVHLRHDTALRRFGARMLRLRSYFLMAIKLLLPLKQMVRAFWTQAVQPPPAQREFDFVLLARGYAPIEYFRSLSSRLAEAGQRVAVFYDPTLHDIYRRTPEHYFDTERIDFLVADPFIKLRDYFSAFFECFRGIPRSMPVTLSNGSLTIQDDWSALMHELCMAAHDIYFHQKKLSRFLTHNRCRVVISGEMISPYPPYQEEIAKRHGCRFFTYQAFSVAREAAVDMVHGDGVMVQSKAVEAWMKAEFPEAAARIQYPGEVNYREEPMASVDIPRRIVFATQVNDLDGLQLRLIEQSLRVARESGFQGEYWVKVHPRDLHTGPKCVGMPGVRVVFSGEMSNREMLESTDLMIATETALFADCLLLGVPYIACAFTQFQRELGVSYLAPELGVKVTSPEAMEERIRNYRQYREEFAARREKLLPNLYSPFDIEHFLRLAARDSHLTTDPTP